jgi:hypothetical protein
MEEQRAVGTKKGLFSSNFSANNAKVVGSCDYLLRFLHPFAAMIIEPQ